MEKWTFVGGLIAKTPTGQTGARHRSDRCRSGCQPAAETATAESLLLPLFLGLAQEIEL